MNSSKKIFGILTLLSSFFLVTSPGSAQDKGNGTIIGQVLDSKTNKPIENVNVFIPFTSIGVITDVNGWFMLQHVNTGLVDLCFRHIAYEPINTIIEVKSFQKKRISANMVESTIEIGEVVKRAKIANQARCLKLFKKFVLGDEMGFSCSIENPEALYFYYENSIMSTYAKEPLIIQNKLLGYKLKYFLDYFNFHFDTNSSTYEKNNSYFYFAGSALYEDLNDNSKWKKKNWDKNRAAFFKGTLRNFLESLYQENIAESGFLVVQAYSFRVKLLQNLGVEGDSLQMAKASIDSVFSFDQTAETTKYYYYSKQKPYSLLDKTEHVSNNGTKKLDLQDSLLIFFDYKQTPDFIHDDEVNLFYLDKGFIEFDSSGLYSIYNGELNWGFLGNRKSLKEILPKDYHPLKMH